MMITTRLPITERGKSMRSVMDLGSLPLTRERNLLPTQIQQMMSKIRKPQRLCLTKSCYCSSLIGFRRRTPTVFSLSPWTQKSCQTTMRS
uniref:Uncharacterized protein MANES_11G110400 n=1 Tax=Rhizophora mucronata TaxID=61149 RepID=A0A2P2LHP3_RHIMU